MPTICWIAPEIPSARYSFGATVCPDDPICRSMGNHPLSQIGRDAASSPPSASANCFASSIFFCSLMPRPTDTIISACVKSTACFASLKTSCGLFRTTASGTSTFTVSIGAAAAPAPTRPPPPSRFAFVGGERAILKGHKVRPRARKAHVGHKLSLKHLPREQQLPAFILVPDRVGEGSRLQGRRQLRYKIPNLVRMRHQHQLRRMLP